MRDWEGLGFAMYKQKQRMFFESTLCCLTPLFNLVLICFGFWVFLVFCFFHLYFFLPSQTWVLGFGFGRLQKILCLVFHSFVVFLPSCPFIFPKIKFVFFPLPNLPFFGIDLLEFLRLSPCCQFLLFVLTVTAFCSKFSFIKGKPAQFRFHSSEFSVSMMHPSLLL
jgi:hypothetical protein